MMEEKEKRELIDFLVMMIHDDYRVSVNGRRREDIYNFCVDAVAAYEEPHRVYHGINHIRRMIASAIKRGWTSGGLLVAILGHDLVYDPRILDKGKNETDSASKVMQTFGNATLREAILDTIDHNPTSELGKMLCELDLENLYGPIESFIEYENEVFKEYQFMDWSTYREQKVPFLESMNVPETHVNYLKYRRPNIAVYPGSFNMFHKGHLNILQKAERIFDKVIIARGHNPEKSEHTYPMPEILKYHQIEEYGGLLTDFVKGLGYDVTVIRGLRNFTDMQYELNQYRFLQELMPEIKMVSIFCDKEFEHISSSTLRMLEKYGKDERYTL
jgi:pantetheine-phosphate adenylyltransferase